MSIVDTTRTALTKLVDGSLDPYPMDHYYGAEEWKTLDTVNQSNPFMYLDPIEGDAENNEGGSISETYNLQFLFGKCMDLDLDKAAEEAAIWEMRSYAKQYLRRLFLETNVTGAKVLMPFESASITEVRKFLATNVYGVIVQVNAKERFPSESC